MQRFLNKLIRIVTYAYYWVLDYVYVSSWQVKGLIHRGNPDEFLQFDNAITSTPILLIPGIYERWEFMNPLVDILHDAGYRVHIIEAIGYNRGSIEEMAQKVVDYTKEHSLKGCIIVAHSKGGLIGKYLMSSDHDESTFKGMIALHAPFSGSKYAYLFPQKSIRVFAPNSSLLSSLMLNEAVNARIVSVYGQFDPHIPGGSYLKGARNIQLEIYGHFRIMGDSSVHEVVLDELHRMRERGRS